MLSWSPLLWIGARSYGLYLWHWPVFVFLDAERLGLEHPNVLLLGIRWVITFGIAAISFRYVETPIRRGAWTPRLERYALVGAVVAIATATPLVTQIFVRASSTDRSTTASSDVDPSSGQLDSDSIRVLVVGDSVAIGLATQRPVMIDGKTRLIVRSSTLRGCGITRGDILLKDLLLPYLRSCDERPENWARATAEFVPDVTVMLLGAWEVFDRRLDGQSLMLGSSAHREDLIERLEQSVDILRGDGRPVFLLTVPCYKGRPGMFRGLHSFQNDPSRRQILNQVYRIAESRFPEKVQLLDLQDLVCPDGTYQAELDDVVLHQDGVHYTVEGARRIWAWLGPQLVAAHEANESSSRAGAGR
jgi:hypothetical protein